MAEKAYRSTDYILLRQGIQNPQDIRHVIYVSPEKCIFQLVDREGQILACKQVNNAEGLAWGIFLRLALQKSEEWLTWNLKRQVIVETSGFALIPKAFFTTHYTSYYAQILLDENLMGDELYTDPVETLEAVLLYVAPPFVKHVLDEYLGDYTTKHINTLCLHLSRELAQAYPEHFLLHASDSHVIIVLQMDGKLQISNAYPFQSPAGLIYFIRSMQQIMGGKSLSCPVFVIGDWSKNESLIEYLSEHISEIRVPSVLQERLIAPSEDTVYWKFAHLATDIW